MSYAIRTPKEAPAPSRSRRGRQGRYPWQDLVNAGIGHSFEVEAEDGEDVKKLASSIQSSGYNWLRRNEHMTLTVLVRPNEEEGTVSVWLMEKLQGSAPEENQDHSLPEGIPGQSALLDAEITTLEEVLEVEDLTSISGIGQATATRIREFLASQVEA